MVRRESDAGCRQKDEEIEHALFFGLCTGIWQSVRFDGVFSEAGFSIDSAV